MRRKRRLRLILLLLLLLMAALLVTARLRFYPMARDLAVTQVVNRTGNLINDAIDEQIKRGTVDYGSMVHLEKGIDGKVTALKTNIGEINKLKTLILDIVNEEILELDVDEIGVPVGSLFFPAFFSGSGPLLPVRVLSISSSDASFHNQFSQAGINQTLHQIIMEVTVQMTILTPVGTEQLDVSTEVVVAETVIVGSVPYSYLAVDDSKTE